MSVQRGEPAHESVLVDEVVGWLGAPGGGTLIDCTLGLGGHTEALLAASDKTRVFGIDQDHEALDLALKRLERFGERFRAIEANFANLTSVINDLRLGPVDGVLADLGVSSLQLDAPERGFSFQGDGPLDMRMDKDQGVSASDLVNSLPETELANLIFEYGEERASRRIARAIVRARARTPISTTRELADIVVRAVRAPGRWRIHPATRTFQALRIAVNRELDALRALIPAAINALAPGGRLAVISFHSLEDRIVKRAFQLESGRCLCAIKTAVRIRPQKGPEHRGPDTPDTERQDETVCAQCGARRRVRVLTRKPIRATDEEAKRNPRARSARLRVCERIRNDDMVLE
jgi:16S rRNA (cytosine1402-N4)-methyltransferase